MREDMIREVKVTHYFTLSEAITVQGLYGYYSFMTDWDEEIEFYTDASNVMAGDCLIMTKDGLVHFKSDWFHSE